MGGAPPPDWFEDSCTTDKGVTYAVYVSSKDFSFDHTHFWMQFGDGYFHAVLIVPPVPSPPQERLRKSFKT